MKVLVLANNDVGLYKFRKELIEAILGLKNTGNENNSVYISLPEGKYTQALVDLGCIFINTPIDRRGVNPLTDMVLFLRYIKILLRVKPDIVLTYTIKPNIFGGLSSNALHIPYVTNITGLGSAVENGGGLQKLTVFLYRIALSNAQRIFFQNNENMEFFRKKRISVEKYSLLPGSGVNISDYQPLEYPPDNTIEFAFISRIMKEKGIDQYLEMAKVIKAKYQITRFHVCGFCEEEYEEVLQKSQKEGIIQYHGMLDDIRDILRITHCTVHPSYYPEGLSNVLLESCACARPIIATDRSGCREVVDVGKNGFLVRTNDTKDLVAKVESFIALPYEQKKQMGIEGREKIEIEYDRDIIINKYRNEIGV